MQDVSNLTIPEGQVRTIHDKDNRLIWGRLAYDTKYIGDTYQQTYSGKNLFDVVSLSNADYVLANEVVTVVKTWTVAGRVYMNSTNLVAGTYTLSYNATLSGDTKTLRFSIVNNTASTDIVNTTVGSIDGSRKKYTFTLAENANIKICLMPNNSGGGTLTLAQIQLEQDSTATSYEPYTGGIPAPNPDYPQGIDVVTGEQTIKLTGKNMAQTTDCNVSGSNYSMSISKGSVELKSQATNVCFDLNAGTRLGAWMPNYASAPDHHLTGNGGTYTVSFHDTSTSGLNSNTVVGVFTNKRSNSITISSTLPLRNINISLDSDEYVKSILYWIGSGTTDCTIKFKVQLEQGSTSSLYESYQSKTCQLSLGSTELVKVNTARDYIYPSNGDWYTHNDIEKIASYNGETITTDYMSTTGQLTTGATVYYVLSSPTDTQITDTTLISQLDAIHEWMTRYGYNATVIGNLPIIIDRNNL